MGAPSWCWNPEWHDLFNRAGRRVHLLLLQAPHRATGVSRGRGACRLRPSASSNMSQLLNEPLVFLALRRQHVHAGWKVMHRHGLVRADPFLKSWLSSLASVFHIKK